MGKASKGGYYAVQKGRSPGIFNTWAECEAATKGYAGAVFKKFPTQAAAQDFVKGDGYGASRSSGGGEISALSSSASQYVPTANANASTSRNEPSRSYHPYAKQGSGSRGGSSTSSKTLYNVMASLATSPDSTAHKIVVYCDGSSIGNGKIGARAGWGVFFEDTSLHHLNESRRLPGPTQTNNRAELMAIIRAIQLCPNDGRLLEIVSDSKYSMDAVTKWLPNWKRNNWKTATGGQVQNQDLIQQLDIEIEARWPKPKLIYVKGHSGIDGNEIVDRMAKFGASLPESDSLDLSKRSSAPESHTTKDSVEVIGTTVTTKRNALQF
ncbi:related to Ribonuclease H [Melanopsichium pennsylvanicum]|uniref:Ribonuclease H n=2 Tax=Melanopsichium pennsylvanicum TaxID=63383 RepID=A0AAJ4XLL3_9BASI|nr:related to Ribonuclease H [Melanopsichium pennsylvanicum]